MYFCLMVLMLFVVMYLQISWWETRLEHPSCLLDLSIHSHSILSFIFWSGVSDDTRLTSNQKIEEQGYKWMGEAGRQYTPIWRSKQEDMSPVKCLRQPTFSFHSRHLSSTFTHPSGRMNMKDTGRLWKKTKENQKKYNKKNVTTANFSFLLSLRDLESKVENEMEGTFLFSSFHPSYTILPQSLLHFSLPSFFPVKRLKRLNSWLTFPSASFSFLSTTGTPSIHPSLDRYYMHRVHLVIKRR